MESYMFCVGEESKNTQISSLKKENKKTEVLIKRPQTLQLMYFG